MVEISIKDGFSYSTCCQSGFSAIKKTGQSQAILFNFDSLHGLATRVTFDFYHESATTLQDVYLQTRFFQELYGLAFEKAAINRLQKSFTPDDKIYFEMGQTSGLCVFPYTFQETVPFQFKLDFPLTTDKPTAQDSIFFHLVEHE